MGRNGGKRESLRDFLPSANDKVSLNDDSDQVAESLNTQKSRLKYIRNDRLMQAFNDVEDGVGGNTGYIGDDNDLSTPRSTDKNVVHELIKRSNSTSNNRTSTNGRRSSHSTGSRSNSKAMTEPQSNQLRLIVSKANETPQEETKGKVI